MVRPCSKGQLSLSLSGLNSSRTYHLTHTAYSRKRASSPDSLLLQLPKQQVGSRAWRSDAAGTRSLLLFPGPSSSWTCLAPGAGNILPGQDFAPTQHGETRAVTHVWNHFLGTAVMAPISCSLPYPIFKAPILTTRSKELAQQLLVCCSLQRSTASSFWLLPLKAVLSTAGKTTEGGTRESFTRFF